MSGRRTVLIVGGYGAFGGRAAERLARFGDCTLIIGGRDERRASDMAKRLGPMVRGARIDASVVSAAEVRALGCDVVLNASGPFQGAPPTLARACIEAGCHYVDLADDRAFVTGIGVLDAAAKQRDVLIVSGASTVPALSAAVIDHFWTKFSHLNAVTYGVSPGNSFDPGLATVRSILSYVGKPFSMRLDGRERTVYGWQGSRRQRFGSLGSRWLGACDVPDLGLFAVRYPDVETLRFGAGMEVGLFHLSMWVLSWLVRAGLVRSPDKLARPLLATKHALDFLGSDAGGMAMNLEGEGSDGKPLRIVWSLVARAGHGPMIPPTPAIVVVRKLLNGTLSTRGARPCLDLVTLTEIQQELSELDIAFEVT